MLGHKFQKNSKLFPFHTLLHDSEDENHSNFQMAETPHPRCPNTLQDFSLEIRAKACITCEMLGQVPGCLGLGHPRVRGISYSKIHHSIVFVFLIHKMN